MGETYISCCLNLLGQSVALRADFTVINYPYEFDRRISLGTGSPGITDKNPLSPLVPSHQGSALVGSDGVLPPRRFK